MIFSKRLLTTICVLFVALSLSAHAGAQCLTTWSQTNSSDIEFFGLSGTGARHWVGQQFTTDCEGQFLQAAFLVSLDLFSFNGVDPLAGGDAVTCTVLDDQNRVIAAVDNVLAAGVGFQWVVFDFSPLQLGLAAGQLSVRLDTALDAYGWVASDVSSVPGSLMLGDGINTFVSDSDDAAFEVFWDPDAIVVGTEEHSWGAVKALYR